MGDINITEVAKIFCDAWKQQVARYTNEKAALLKKCGVDFIGDCRMAFLNNMAQ